MLYTMLNVVDLILTYLFASPFWFFQALYLIRSFVIRIPITAWYRLTSGSSACFLIDQARGK